MTSPSGAGDGGGQVRGLAPSPILPADGTVAGGPAPAPPAPGELHIKEKRSWKTWQLVTGMLVAALIGMALNYNSSGASSSASSGGSKAYKLPPPAATGGAAPTTTTPSSTLPPGSTKGARSHAAASGGATHQHASVATTTTAPAVTTTTTGATTTTTASGAAPGPLQLLIPVTQMHGNWTSPAFNITAAPWNIGWAFQCTPAPASGPSFQVFVAPVGGKPGATPPVSETGASGQQVTQVQSTGNQVVMVQAPANCLWAVKITGN